MPKSSSQDPDPLRAHHTGIVSCAVLREFAVSERLFHPQDAEALWKLILDVVVSNGHLVKYRGRMLRADDVSKLSEKQRKEECSLLLTTVAARYISIDRLLRKGPTNLYDLFADWQRVNILE